jgi:hypothetical protein
MGRRRDARVGRARAALGHVVEERGILVVEPYDRSGDRSRGRSALMRGPFATPAVPGGAGASGAGYAGSVRQAVPQRDNRRFCRGEQGPPRRWAGRHPQTPADLAVAELFAERRPRARARRLEGPQARSSSTSRSCDCRVSAVRHRDVRRRRARLPRPRQPCPARAGAPVRPLGQPSVDERSPHGCPASRDSACRRGPPPCRIPRRARCSRAGRRRCAPGRRAYMDRPTAPDGRSGEALEDRGNRVGREMRSPGRDRIAARP